MLILESNVLAQTTEQDSKFYLYVAIFYKRIEVDLTILPFYINQFPLIILTSLLDSVDIRKQATFSAK